ncbi:MAG: cell surface protein SprA, partial [Flavobacteriia bacterium]|nr:cell surface protein SprA [Flavobacteriia bacterium]
SSKGKRQEINVSGKAQVQTFEMAGDSYEANRHYFLNLYHHEHYDEAMATLPIVNSGVNITKLEVWVTNKTNATENTRNIIAFTDLGEEVQGNCQGNPGGFSSYVIPDNDANGLYDWAKNQPTLRSFASAVNTLNNQTVAPGPFQQATHFEKIENARRLTDQEFSYNSLLGFISLNLPLNNDEVLAVAYEYTYKNETYQVGEFSTDGSAGKDALFLKLLKPTITNPKNKLWDLMMKNVYSIGAYQVGQQGFRINFLYNNPETSVLIPFFPLQGVDDIQLVTLLNMDKINTNNQPFSDGVFDFVPMNLQGNRSDNGGTINVKNGRVYFSTIEPFGKTLSKKLQDKGISQTIINQVAFNELYDSTKTAAQQIPAKNRFSFKGEYQSSVSSDIPLNALNVPQGAVSVTAGGMKLVEGSDYTVDYNLGRVKILNTGILESNTPIKISIESNSVFGFQARSLVGGRYNYKFSKNLNVGATWMRMMERPVTQKVDFGSEPFKNNILGLDLAFKTELPLLTKVVDLLPVISTKEKSTFSFSGEFAHIIPGVPKAINKSGTSYVDDFEGAQSTIDLRTYTAWRLASIPQGQADLFPEASQKDLSSGFNRSKLAWYTIDPLLNGQGNSLTPANITNDPDMLSDSRMRMVVSKDLFPNTQLAYGSVQNLPILDLAYYPTERGMYNYEANSATIGNDGKFINPENRWGGIMRGLTTNDFEQTNIEFIQFWILDPFNEDAENVDPNSSHSGGNLYFNLGNISEDVLPDSRKSYENGLPQNSTVVQNTDITPWARVSTSQTTVNAFDNDPASRINQDVGLDGWSSADEKIAFATFVNWVQNSSLDPAVKAELIADPSSDNYNFYRDDNYDTASYDILQRYKKYNGTDGNSATQQMSDTMNADKFPTQATNYPDVEDLNQDNNIGEAESYFQYKISLHKNDLVVGKNFITSKQEKKIGNKVETWYQFKVPLREYERKVNNIQDFRSIRFMRMFLKDFDEEVVIRFARLEFVRGEWRRYFNDLSQPGEAINPEPNSTDFTIGAVNIEENAQRVPVNYDIPPGIIREVDPSQTYQRQLNEQSLSLNVCGLKDGDSKAGYKNVQFDVRTYKKLKMYAHVEEVNPGTLDNEDVTLFVRLGTDLTDNYYEYEYPLYKTDWGSNLSPELIWPTENDMEIIFEDLINLKIKRNDEISNGNTSISTLLEYIIQDPNNPKRLIKIKGNPNLQAIKNIMVGVRNPNKNSNTPWKATDDGESKCVIVWINELRLTDFVSEGGSAAVAQMQVQAADFATVSMSGNYSGLNWGAVDSRVQDRQRNQKMGFDMNSSMQLGQFFGKKTGLSLPFFYGRSIGVINPEYDPFNPDTKLSTYDSETKRERQRLGQDYNERVSYNFTNVKKELKAGATPYFWRISNWSLNYSYSENIKRDFNTKNDKTKIWTTGLNYNYSFNAKPIEPFKKVKFMQKSKWWTIVKETNFYLSPKNISFSNDILRNYNERQVRNNIVPTLEFQPVFVKQFTWNRKYALGYDITKNLKFNFNATNKAIFVENNSRVDRKLDPLGYQNFKDTVFSQLNTFGKTMDYTHDYNFSYNLPLDKIPALNWVTANTKYTGTYNWQRAPLGQSDFGNTIQNSRTVNLTTQLNFVNLYTKVPYFKKVIDSGKSTNRAKINTKGVTDNKDGKKPEPEKTPETKPKDEKPESEMTRKELREKKKAERKKEKEKEAKEKEKQPINPVGGFLARMVMSVQNVSGTYSLTDGTLLAGYNKDASVLGMSGTNQFGNMGGFIFGQQTYDVMGKKSSYNIADRLSSNNSLVKNENLNKPHTVTHNQTINFRASLQPMKDLTIELTGNRVYGNNISDFYRWNSTTNQFEAQSQMQTGTLTYTTISTGSAFDLSTSKNLYRSTSFDKMRDNLSNVSQLLGAKNPYSTSNSQGFYSGYSSSQQDVLIGSFLTTYTNNPINDRNINPIKNVPLPNWSISYNGLTKFEFTKKYVKNFVIRHAYSSTVSVSGIQTNLKAHMDNNGIVDSRDVADNFYSAFTIQNVTVTERFSPLIGIDATWNIKNQGLTTKFEIKRDRTATLSTINTQITEIVGKEIVLGIGYKFAKVKLPFEKIDPSPVNIRFDLSIRDNQTVIRKIIDNTNQATAGQRVFSIKSSADYNIGQNLVLQFYFDQVINTPKVQTSFPTANLSTGIKLRFNLAGVQ